MPRNSSFRIRDKGSRDFQKLGIVLGNVELRVGILKKDGAKPHPSGRSDLTVAQVAQIHELGLHEPVIPKRSFLRGWFDDNRSAIINDIRRAGVASWARRDDIRKQARVLGVKFSRQIQARIRGGIPPENEISTVERKGSGVALIDSRALLNAIDSEVERVRR